MFEQEVEDCNAVHKIDNHLVRRLIVMPLTDAFNPHSSNVMFGKVQFGDKCSLPASIGRLVFEGNDGKPYEVPWLFEIKPVNSRRKKSFATVTVTPAGGEQMEGAAGEAQAQAQAGAVDAGAEAGAEAEADRDPVPPRRILDKAYISPLDFRSPENYIFLPRWLMATLGLRVNDLVDVSFVRIQLAGLVVFQPLTLAWDQLIGAGEASGGDGEGDGDGDGAAPKAQAQATAPDAAKDPKTILEHELNKYSALTAGSVVEIEYRGTVYPLLIKETRAENGVRVLGVRVQDSDVKVEIDRRVVDALRKREELRRELAGEGEGDEGEGEGESEGESEEWQGKRGEKEGEGGKAVGKAAAAASSSSSSSRGVSAPLDEREEEEEGEEQDGEDEEGDEEDEEE